MNTLMVICKPGRGEISSAWRESREVSRWDWYLGLGSQNQQEISSRCISGPLLGFIDSGDLDVLSNLRRSVLQQRQLNPRRVSV